MPSLIFLFYLSCLCTNNITSHDHTCVQLCTSYWQFCNKNVLMWHLLYNPFASSKQTYRSLIRIMEVDLDDNLKLSPPCLRQLIRRLGDDPVWIGVALMQFEVHLLDVSWHVFVLIGLHVDRPLVSVAVLFSLFPEVTRYVAVYYRFDDCNALESVMFWGS